MPVDGDVEEEAELGEVDVVFGQPLMAGTLDDEGTMSIRRKILWISESMWTCG